jgi:adenylosuccinate synthase
VNHVIVVDLGYGDAGKGTVVDWLCSRQEGRPVRMVVRFNGGAQAAHNVVTRDGRHHAFAQFGAGTFASGVRTHLSRFVLIDPLAVAAEAAHLASLGVAGALDLLTVDRDALLATPRAAWASGRPPATPSRTRRMHRAPGTAPRRACSPASWPRCVTG